jgi:hypothetical protein
MTGDEIIVAAIVVAFASLLTTHVAIAAGLASRIGPARALLALVAFPLAPWWGARRGMHGRAVLWITSAGAYVVLRVFARH